MKRFKRTRRIVEETDDFRNQTAAQNNGDERFAQKKEPSAPSSLPEQNPDKSQNQKIRNVLGEKNARIIDKKIPPAESENEIEKRNIHEE